MPIVEQFERSVRMDRSLLILDDDAAVASTIRMMAERIGFQVAITDNAPAFFTVLTEWAPTHIAVDLVMPLVDGVEILLELARRGCPSNIIITSGAGSRILDAAQRASTEHGLSVLGTLSKPFTFAKFRSLMGQDVVLPDATVNAPEKEIEIAEGDLREALDQRQISIAYQPKIRCSDERVFGFEALARWTHPTMGAISPSNFIPVAERCGIIDELTDFIFEGALDWLGASFPQSEMHIAINLSAKTLSDIRLADRFAKATSDRSIDPHRVILEVTETSAMADPLMTLSLATRLRLKGFHLSIDDFGIGYSSLVQLARLPFSELKVDTSFVRSLGTSTECQKIVRAIIGLGHSLGLRVAAEGVEDQQSLAMLKDMHCDLAQGYFIGRPMTGEAVSNWTARRSIGNLPNFGTAP